MNPYDYPDPPRVPELTPGDYYANKDAARKHWDKWLVYAKGIGRPTDEIAWLQRKYEAACYVGD